MSLNKILRFVGLQSGTTSFHSEDVACGNGTSVKFIQTYRLPHLFLGFHIKILSCALIFLLRLRFPPGKSIATSYTVCTDNGFVVNTPMCFSR